MDVLITCKCPGQHGQDTITFFDRLDFRRAMTIQKALGFIETTNPATRPAEVLAVLSEYYLLYGVQSWTIVGTDKKRVAVNPDSVRAELLEHPDAWMLVEAADAQYQEQVLLPLVNRASGSSQTSQTEKSTSPKPAPKTRKRSPRSSISTIPTVDTETTSSSLDGVSSSSQSSESAA